MKEKERILFRTSLSFREFIFRVFLVVCIALCIFYIRINPAGLSVVIILLLMLIFLGFNNRVIVYSDRFVVIRERIITSMNDSSTYQYSELESVQFKEDNYWWLANILTNRSADRNDQFVIIYKEDKVDTFYIHSSRNGIRKAVELINGLIHKHSHLHSK